MKIDLQSDGATIPLPTGGTPKPRPYADLPKAVRRQIQDDAKWFLRHPSRTVRLRDPAPGEAESLASDETTLPAAASGYPLKIVVLQHFPGWRIRRPVWTVLNSSAPEEVVLAFLRLVMDGLEQGYFGEIGADDIRAAMGEPLTSTRH